MMARPPAPATTGRRIPIVTTDTLGQTPIRHGTTVHACAISGANILRDMREAVTNTLGGKMRRYEKLLDQTIERALDALEERAVAAGYEAVVGLRLSHPVITDGAIEIVASGTGVWIDRAA
jgi:uncharacterized protein YbjQ (UPF0145 family)